jgi:alpha,alpha-trehalose phosphorylase
MKIRATDSTIPRHRFPVEPWRLVETEPSPDDLGHTETLFAIGNGYIGMRANPSEGRDAYTHGSYVNGFHETWRIQHAEDAFAFAKTGQTIVNVPDAKLMKLYVDDEPLLLRTADLEHYERALDFRSGVSYRELIWRTPAGKRVKVRSERMVSLQHRHLAVMRLEITLLDGTAPIIVSSQLLNRQDGEDEYHVKAAALGEGTDPRKARKFDRRVLQPTLQRHDDADDHAGGEITLGFRCTNSGMTIACAYRHELDTPCDYTVETDLNGDHARSVFAFRAQAGNTIRLTKYVSYHSSRGVPSEELSHRCKRTITRARGQGVQSLYAEQAAWLEEFWHASDVEIDGDPAAQQAIRWNLYHLAMASARAHEQGIAAKALTAGGYDGHYFWDTEVYVLPYLAYTNPDAARKLLRFRYHMLDDARARAQELSERGALYPWRTINGEEASAYYAAGTAQYHINAAIVYALERYLNATGDVDFLAREGAEILVETARLYEDLGFYDNNGAEHFHIHGVTGPDEYTTVVNDNLYTNVMARFVLRYAARCVTFLREWAPDAHAALERKTGVEDSEIASWHRAADAMYLPFDETLGIHPQDASFIDRERWDFANTPAEKYPLLLHFHPLVIYRHQVLKQADVVLAMYLRTEHFTLDQKRRNFDYYDPITTGDSSLSACVQSIAASQVGYDDLAHDYFEQSLYLDLANTHGNTADGVHIANAGGIWAALVHGFAGLVDNGNDLSFEPRLPEAWTGMTFRLLRHGASLCVDVDRDGATVTVESTVEPVVGADDGGTPLVHRVPIRTLEGVRGLAAGESLRIPARPAPA